MSVTQTFREITCRKCFRFRLLFLQLPAVSYFSFYPFLFHGRAFTSQHVTKGVILKGQNSLRNKERLHTEETHPKKDLYYLLLVAFCSCCVLNADCCLIFSRFIPSIVNAASRFSFEMELQGIRLLCSSLTCQFPAALYSPGVCVRWKHLACRLRRLLFLLNTDVLLFSRGCYDEKQQQMFGIPRGQISVSYSTRRDNFMLNLPSLSALCLCNFVTF